MKALIMAVEGKGGVSKSLSTGLAIEMLRERGASVSIVDADATNSSTLSLYPEGRFLDLSSAKVAGALVGLFEDPADFVVVDVGARDEATIKKNFAYMREAAKKARARIVALRPVNLNVAVHANIRAWLTDHCDGEISFAVMLRSVACGRDEDAFGRRWAGYGWKALAIKAGRAREILLTDLGAEYAENLQTIQTPLSAIVAGEFRAPEGAEGDAYRAFCEAVYDRDARLHIGIWLKENGGRLIAALQELGIKV